MGDWTFFSNHGHVLVCLAKNGRARLRDVAQDVGITERAVQKIVKDLQAGGYITVRKQGRCNRYRVNRRKTLRHALESHCTLGKLLALVAPAGKTTVKPESAVAVPAVEEAAPEAKPAIEPEPAPDREPAPMPEPEPEPKPRPEPAAAPEPASKPKSRPSTETDSTPRPPDIEQQGSLF